MNLRLEKPSRKPHREFRNPRPSRRKRRVRGIWKEEREDLNRRFLNLTINQKLNLKPK